MGFIKNTVGLLLPLESRVLSQSIDCFRTNSSYSLPFVSSFTNFTPMFFPSAKANGSDSVLEVESEMGLVCEC